ncbi:MAG TPA: ScbR family autoregulator-binding transcription factor [Nonomuraea sp.]|nr:ScbR family autoregulator-binding transcription factor [Nonomuraea sp.]
MSNDPKTGRPVQERAKRTRHAIMLAAADAFAAQGYAAASMTDIASRAGVTKGALAFHFPAKRDLAVALVEAFDRDRDDLLARLEPQSGLAMIWSVLQSLATQFRDDPVIRAAVRLQNESSSIDAPLPPRYAGWIGTFTDLYARAASDGSLRPEFDPATLGRLTVAAFFGIQHVSEALTGRADIHDRLREFWDLFQLAVRTT